MGGICQDRVVVVTGGGRGLGRAHALAAASEGARVVVNDVDAVLDGTSRTRPARAAQQVVDEIVRAGGQAVADTEDVASWAGAEAVTVGALAEWGRLDALVCSAGNLLDRELVDMTQPEWDAVVTTHLTGHAAPLHHAARHWRSVAEETGAPSGGRAVLTSSAAGIWGDAGRTNYSAAKAGVAMLGRTAARELERFGVTVNVLAPFARTRMTISLDAGLANVPPPERFDPVDPGNVAPLVVWLCSAESAGVTGEVFKVHGGNFGLVEPPGRGPASDAGRRREPAEIGSAVAELTSRRDAS